MSDKQSTVEKSQPSGTVQRMSPSRRRFLTGMASTPLVAAVAGLPPVVRSAEDTVTTRSDELGPLDPESRRLRAAKVRRRALILARDRPLPAHPNNDDENRFPNFIGNYHKGLPHTQDGLVDPAAYEAFRDAINSGTPEAFANVPGGCADPAQQRPLNDPQSAHSFTLSGPDSHQGFMPPAPAFDNSTCSVRG